MPSSFRWHLFVTLIYDSTHISKGSVICWGNITTNSKRKSPHHYITEMGGVFAYINKGIPSQKIGMDPTASIWQSIFARRLLTAVLRSQSSCVGWFCHCQEVFLVIILPCFTFLFQFLSSYTSLILLLSKNIELWKAYVIKGINLLLRLLRFFFFS